MSTVTELQSGRLPHLGVLRFTGPDALSFLQGQVSNDTRRLAEGSPLLAAYSNPQGRVLAVMHLLPHSVRHCGHSAARTSGADPGKTAQVRAPRQGANGGRRRWRWRCRVNTARTPCRRPAWPFLPAAKAMRSRTASGSAGCGQGLERFWVIGPAEKLGERGLAGDPGQAARIEHDWRLADIRDGLPQIYLGTHEAFVAQMLNLDLLDGISFSKGCYTGQEIIARTQHLGRIKRRLFRLRLPHGDWSIGQSLRLSDGRSGRLTRGGPKRRGLRGVGGAQCAAGRHRRERICGERRGQRCANAPALRGLELERIRAWRAGPAPVKIAARYREYSHAAPFRRPLPCCALLLAAGTAFPRSGPLENIPLKWSPTSTLA